MENFKAVVQTGSFFLFILLAVLLVVAFSNIFKLNKKINRLKKRYDNILKGRGELNIEEVLVAHSEDLESFRKELSSITASQNKIKNDMALAIQKVGFHKYDAFPDLSNKLSYSLVLLDSQDNGVILTSIYGRESSVTFSKRVEGGNSKESISDDEKVALERALNSQK